MVLTWSTGALFRIGVFVERLDHRAAFALRGRSGLEGESRMNLEAQSLEKELLLAVRAVFGEPQNPLPTVATSDRR